MNLSQAILVLVVLAPGVVFGVLAFLWFLGWVPGERAVSRLTGVTCTGSRCPGVGTHLRSGFRHRGDLRELVRRA
jgi:hypothetical protein